VRILYPNGDRLDFCTNGDSTFKLLLDHLSKEGFRSRSHELIERLMPTYRGGSVVSTTAATRSSSSQNESSQTKAISNEMSMLAINQSRNLLNGDHSTLTFKELNLFPRVFLLLQEI
jgi:hypothetical protein